MKNKKTVPYYKKPSGLTTARWQKSLRKQLIVDKTPPFIINYFNGEHPVFADYTVENPLSGGTYKVALRSHKPGPNFCTCMDFKTNLLGTCKHIEAVLYFISKNRKLAKLLKEDYQATYSSIYLKYGDKRQVTLRIGLENTKQYEELAAKYFDNSYHLLVAAYDKIDHFLTSAARINSDFRCYPDAMDFIIDIREKHKRKTIIEQKIGDSSGKYFDHLLKTELFPYQKDGILFAARAGRCLIADDMGLGKTVQALGTTELFKKEFGIQKVLIICPTSLKYQWKSEIEKLTGSSVSVIEGNSLQRQKQYDGDSFYKIVSYNVAGIDSGSIKKLEPDFVILDEAQRIKNLKTKLAQQIKKIESPYAIVLTGTPIENKLEELYSIVQFIDPFKLGPLYKFLEDHQIQDETGKVTGYKQLNQIMAVLSEIVIRRTKKEVLAQLPSRSDKNLFVPLTPEQKDIHSSYADIVARLVNKWKRFGFLDEKDRQRLLLALNSMRMVSDSTYILDQETRFDTKIAEVMYIIEDIFTGSEDKIVVFSQWERMTRLVRPELESRKIGYAYLTGSVLSKNRKTVLDEFHDNPECRVFLSTDAGGIGLNLQSASFVINLDIPWNPAVLEQRIGRIYRHGQKKNVNIINLISAESIEQRMLDVLKFKASLFTGVLDNGEDRIFMGEDKFKRFMRSVEEVGVSPRVTAPVTKEEEPDASSIATSSPAAELFTAAETFFGVLGKTIADKPAADQLVASFIGEDTQTGKKYLKIPIENEQLVEKAVGALTGFLALLKKS